MWRQLAVTLVLASLSLVQASPAPQRIEKLFDDISSNFIGDEEPQPTPKLGEIQMMSTKQSSGCQNVQYRATAAGQRATITSPNYPFNYPDNTDCSYFVNAPAGVLITISCTINIACQNNEYIKWSLTGRTDFSDAAGYCGRGTTPTQTSQANSLSVAFHSESRYNRPPTSLLNPYRYTCDIRTIAGPTQPTTTTPRPSTTSTTPQPGLPTTTPQSGGPACSCGARNVNGVTRIVGGTATKNGELPWRVTVFVYDPSTGRGGLCGGTIISQSWIMTAAHCTMDKQPTDRILVFTEAQANPVTQGGAVSNNVDRYVQHPLFNRRNLDNDITLLHLQTPLTFKNNVSPACLPYGALATSDFNGTTVLASGWGTTQPVPVGTNNTDSVSDTLLEVSLPVLTTAQCSAYLTVTPNQICTYLPGKDTCQGDSGGSIDYQYTDGKYYSIGITSFGFGCAQENYPGAYTKVNNYLTWIPSVTGETYCSA